MLFRSRQFNFPTIKSDKTTIVNIICAILLVVLIVILIICLATKKDKFSDKHKNNKENNKKECLFFHNHGCPFSKKMHQQLKENGMKIGDCAVEVIEEERNFRVIASSKDQNDFWTVGYYADFKKAKEEIDNLNSKIAEVQKRLIDINKKQKLLDGIPCGDGFPTCKFIKDANIAVATKEQSQNELSDATMCLSKLNPKTVEEKLHQYNVMNNSIAGHEKNISKLKLSREKNKTLKAKTQFALKSITEQINEYEENKETIENLEKLITEQATIRKNIKATQKQLNKSEEKMLEGVKLVGTYEQKVQSLREQKQEYHDLRSSFAAYDLFMRCMHPNGIAYDVIKKKIPVINQEIAKVLANIVEFEIFFESSGNKFDIFIKHPQYDERPIEMASGAEKTMAAMAIRLALLSVSSLPKGDLFILDEPGTALDEENMEGFIRILELIKIGRAHV